jgi:23S rRNA pseudouridine2605 synthase
MAPLKPKPVSLARALSKLGFTSRSLAEEMIRKGRVRLDGVVEKNPSRRCDPARDSIVVDGARVRSEATICLALHKPAGLVTTRSDERGRPTVYSLLGEHAKWVFPVGRLDKETSGLLLLTNDHRWGEKLTNPRSKIPKTYLVGLDKPLKPDDAALMRKGMTLNGVPLLPAGVRTLEGSMVEMVIREGKNRQIRKMCESLGYAVRSLARTKIGAYTLGSLKPGEVRRLGREEIALCLKTE